MKAFYERASGYICIEEAREVVGMSIERAAPTYESKQGEENYNNSPVKRKKEFRYSIKTQMTHARIDLWNDRN